MARIQIRDEIEIQQPLFQTVVKEAVRLNQTKGDPTRQE
jgi:hypothetical protein